MSDAVVSVYIYLQLYDLVYLSLKKWLSTTRIGNNNAFQKVKLTYIETETIEIRRTDCKISRHSWEWK